MSYILEALARSQRERELGRVPTPTGAGYSEPSGTKRNNKALIIGLLLSAAVVAAATYAVLSLPGPEQTKPGTAAAVAETMPQERTAGSPNSQPDAAPQKATGEPAKPTARPPRPAVATQPVTVKAAPASTDEAQKTVASDRGEVVEQQLPVAPPPEPVVLPEARDASAADLLPANIEEQRVRAADAAVMRQELIELNKRLEIQQAASRPGRQQQAAIPATVSDNQPRPAPAGAEGLPADVYSRLPPRKLSVLAYSKSPERRFVILNTQKMAEGSRSAAGLVVEEIRQNGVIFSFEGHRFFDSP